MNTASPSPELVKRMMALVQHAAVSASGHTQEEAQRIVAVLPNSDLIEARRVIGESYGSTQFMGRDELMIGDGPRRVDDIVTGKGDDYWETKAVVAAIKRGRELATPTSETDQLGGVGV